MKDDGTERRRRFRDYAIEIITALLAIIFTVLFFLKGIVNEPDREDATFVVDVLVGVIIISVVAMKFHFDKILSLKEDSLSLLDKLKDESLSLSNKIGSQLEALSEPHLRKARNIVEETVNTLKKLEEGIEPLSNWDYQVARIDAMDAAGPGWKILAVSTINNHRWALNRRQQIYRDKNFEAKVRGADIQRIFVVTFDRGTGVLETGIKDSIRLQQGHLDVYVTNTHDFEEMSKEKFDDFVIFSHGTERFALKDYPASDDDTDVLRGEKITSADEIEKLQKQFDKLKLLKYTDSELETLLNSSR
jgi:hypothetical protein